MLLYLVRHGETDWNLQHKIQGSTDIPLNDTGREQAAATGDLLTRRSWHAVLSSPLARAFETASIIATTVGLSAPTTVADLAERNYGEAEGLTDAECDERFPDDSPVPGRESREQVVARVLPALLAIAESHPEQSVIVVSHGGVIRSVLNAIDPNGRHGAIGNGSVHSITHENGSLRLIAFDDPIEEESQSLSVDDLDDQNEFERREAARTGA